MSQKKKNDGIACSSTSYASPSEVFQEEVLGTKRSESLTLFLLCNTDLKIKGKYLIACYFV